MDMVQKLLWAWSISLAEDPVCWTGSCFHSWEGVCDWSHRAPGRMDVMVSNQYQGVYMTTDKAQKSQQLLYWKLWTILGWVSLPCLSWRILSPSNNILCQVLRQPVENQVLALTFSICFGNPVTWEFCTFFFLAFLVTQKEKSEFLQ